MSKMMKEIERLKSEDRHRRWGLVRLKDEDRGRLKAQGGRYRGHQSPVLGTGATLHLKEADQG